MKGETIMPGQPNIEMTPTNEILLSILSMIEDRHDKVEELKDDIWQLSYPNDGTRASLGTGTTTIDFEAGTIVDSTGAVTRTSSSLRKHGKEFMQSVALTADHDVEIKFDQHDKIPVRAHAWYHGNQQEFTQLRIKTTEATDVFVTVSTAPALIDMQDSYIHKSNDEIEDWVAVAQNTLVKSSEYDLSDAYMAVMHIQAALDTNAVAHTGTRFIVQTSATDEGDEDWMDATEFVALIGTAATDAIEDNPLAAGSTDIKLTGHGYTTEGAWLLIEDATLVNSELVRVASQTANEVVAIDGTTNAHVLNTAMFNVAMVQSISLPKTAERVRILVDNTYDDNGSTLNYRARVNKVTGL